jgi:hypothetical protein
LEARATIKIEKSNLDFIVADLLIRNSQLWNTLNSSKYFVFYNIKKCTLLVITSMIQLLRRRKQLYLFYLRICILKNKFSLGLSHKKCTCLLINVTSKCKIWQLQQALIVIYKYIFYSISTLYAKLRRIMIKQLTIIN